MSTGGESREIFELAAKDPRSASSAGAPPGGEEGAADADATGNDGAEPTALAELSGALARGAGGALDALDASVGAPTVCVPTDACARRMRPCDASTAAPPASIPIPESPAASSASPTGPIRSRLFASAGRVTQARHDGHLLAPWRIEIAPHLGHFVLLTSAPKRDALAQKTPSPYCHQRRNERWKSRPLL